VLPLAIAGLLLVILRSPPAWTLDLGAPGDNHFSAGFSVPEEGDGATFRWSTDDARLLLHGAGARPFVLDMRLHRNSDTLGQEYRLALRQDKQDGRRFAAFALPPDAGWRTYQVLLPPEAVSDAQMQTLPLALESSTYNPDGSDGRDLGVPVDRVRVLPLAADDMLHGRLLWRTLALMWVLALLAGGLWWLRVALLPRARWFASLLLVGLPVAAAALVLLWWAAVNPYTLAWALPSAFWTLGLLSVLLAALWWGRGTLQPEIQPPPALPRVVLRAPWVALLLVFLLALALRFYQIDSLPYGLWRDEARHGLIALRMLEDPDYRPIYVASGGVNMPALGFYPFALALKLWGVHAWTMRIVTALGGALTVFPLYALVVYLSGRRDVALLAAALLAVSSWHLTLSRYSFPSIFEPLLSLTGLCLLAWAIDTRHNLQSIGAALLSGACLGIAAQMYHTGRVVPVVAGVLALLLLWQQRQQWRHWLLVVATCAAGFVLLVAPLASYALSQPDAMNDRVGRVFLLSNALEQGRSPLGDFDESLGAHLLMFHVQGDGNSRHHAPDRPMLDPVTGMGFLAGCVLLLSRWRDWRSLFLFAALCISMLPSLLAVNGPHAMRSIGAVAYACIIAALGWVWLVALLRRARPAVLRPASLALLPLLVAVALGINAWTYFVYMPTEPRVWTSFYPVHTQVGIYLRELANEEGPQALENIVVEDGLARNAVYRYLTHGLPIDTYTEQNVGQYAAPDTLFVVSGYNYQYHAGKLTPYVDATDEPALTGPDLPGHEDTPAFMVYATGRTQEGRAAP
jgi:4-amino-4-deoxy-L-arabinose transferase-like glycosyltransferase